MLFLPENKVADEQVGGLTAAGKRFSNAHINTMPGADFRYKPQMLAHGLPKPSSGQMAGFLCPYLQLSLFAGALQS
jgi:hypothetical protein